MAQVALAPGKRAKEKLVREMKKRLLADMNKEFVGSRDGADAYTEASRKAETLVQTRWHKKYQGSYADIPVYPNYNIDGIESDAKYPQFFKLWSQLGDHASEVGSALLSTNLSEKRPSGKLPVTPPTPTSNSILLPVPEVPVVEKAESSRDAKRARLERICAGPKAKIPSQKHDVKEEASKEKIIPGKDTYHILRVHQRCKGRYLELLRQDLDGYISAFRILYSLDDFRTAYWCAFSDFQHLSIYLPFLNIQFMEYDPGYGELTNVYFGVGTLDAIIDEFLAGLYDEPDQPVDTKKEIYFHILCLVFGECPRLEAARRFVETNSVVPHNICRDRNARSLKLGSQLDSLIRAWSNTGDTAMLLIICLFEKVIKADIKATRSSSIASFHSLFEQFANNERLAEDRCVAAMESFERIFHLTREVDPSSGKFIYGGLALQQLLNEQLHLVKYNYKLVTSLILRRGGFRRKICFPGVNEESNNVGNQPVTSPSVVFWQHFDIFCKLKLEQISSIDLMLFLDEARPFLVESGFVTAFPDVFPIIDVKLKRFNGIRWKTDLKKKLSWSSGNVAFAAQKAFDIDPPWSVEYTDNIVGHLRHWRQHN